MSKSSVYSAASTLRLFSPIRGLYSKVPFEGVTEGFGRRSPRASSVCVGDVISHVKGPQNTW